MKMICVYGITSCFGALEFRFGPTDQLVVLEEQIKSELRGVECEHFELGDLPNYSPVEVGLALARKLWKELGNVAVDDNGPDGCIEEDFLFFEKGTNVYDVYEWFESTFELSVARDLMRV